MKSTSKREQNRIRQQRKKVTRYAVGGGLAAVALGILGIFLWQGVKPGAGEVIAVPANYVTHVAVGSAVSYPSNPPAGGQHYPETFESGFYDETNLPNRPGDMTGYLVHNLEHGYIIFWYNCTKLDDNACNDLKAQIKAVMDAKNNFKLIAVPWKSIDTPLAMTSWGRLLRFEQFDAGLARNFIDSNLNHSPEPDAQ